MPLTEFVFRIGSRTNPLCEFTRAHKGSRVVIQYLRGDLQEPPKWALFTLVGPRAEADALIRDRLQKEYGFHEVIAGGDDYVSLKVMNRIEAAHGGMDPLTGALKLLGTDAMVNPVIVQDGYIHHAIVSASPNGREAFMAWTREMRARLPPDDFKLVHVRPYDPGLTLNERDGDDDITTRQQEIIRMAIALGYYEDPRGCTLEHLADVFGVSKAAIHKRITAAENRIIKRYYKGG